MKPPAALLLLLLAVHGSALAQQPRSSLPAVRYGKWATAAAAVGFTVAGLRTHQQADRDYRRLGRWCEDVGPCRIGADGRYTSPEAEAAYRAVSRADREARAWLAAGQVAVVATVVLFVIELRRGGEPQDIPFRGLAITAGPHTCRLGLRLAF